MLQIFNRNTEVNAGGIPTYLNVHTKAGKRNMELNELEISASSEIPNYIKQHTP